MISLYIRIYIYTFDVQPYGLDLLSRIVQGLPKRFGKWPERPAMRRSACPFVECTDFPSKDYRCYSTMLSRGFSGDRRYTKMFLGFP